MAPPRKPPRPDPRVDPTSLPPTRADPNRSFTPHSGDVSLSAIQVRLARAEEDIRLLTEKKAQASDHRELRESFKSFVDLEELRDQEDEKAAADRAKKRGDRVWQIVAGALLIVMGAAFKAGWDWLVSTKPQNPPARDTDERR